LYDNVIHMRLQEKLLQARIPEKLYKRVEEGIKSGIYSNRSEVVREALRKMFAEQSRDFLRELARKTGISEMDMLRELKKIRSSS